MKLGTTDISAIKLGSTDISKAMLGSSVVYEPQGETQFYIKNPSNTSVSFHNCENESSIDRGGSVTLGFDYSTDKTNWTTLSQTFSFSGNTKTDSVSVTIPANTTMYFRNINLNYHTYTYYTSGNRRTGFRSPYVKITGTVSTPLVMGGLISTLSGSKLYDYTNFKIQSTSSLDASKLILDVEPKYYYYYIDSYTKTYVNTYASMFNGSTGLVSAPELPFTTLTNSCFQLMFYGCSSLIKAPSILPATTLTPSCYNNMFYNCTSLQTGPEICATNIGTSYNMQYMFMGCKSLNYLKVHFTQWKFSSTDGYAQDCWSKLTQNTTGTFVCPSSLPQNFNSSGNNSTGSTASYIPYGWTVQTY